MLKFSDGTKVPLCFGDFGWNFAMNDTDFARLNYPVAKIEEILNTDEFEKNFRDYLNVVLPTELKIEKTELSDGRKVLKAPALAAYYNIAGQAALAKQMGMVELRFGSYEKRLIFAIAKLCKAIGLNLSIIVSSELSKDEEFLKEIRQYGYKVDTDSCNDYFDLPYTYFEEAFAVSTEYYSVAASANYGAFPKPGLAGVLAGLYGEDLIDALGGHIPEACVVPVDTGFEAVGAYKALSKTDCKLATYESTVAQEFHLLDGGTYSLSVRRDEADRDVTICPELANMWRRAKVARLGCDRVIDIETEAYKTVGLKDTETKAVALAFEAFDCSELLVLEAKI